MNEVVPRQFAVANLHPSFVCVETWSGYRMSALDPSGARHLLAPDCEDVALGRAVLDALSRSRFFSLEEVRSTDFFNRDVRAAIYADWVLKLRTAYGLTRRALFKDLHQCDVTATAGTIVMDPKRHVRVEAWEGFAAGEIPDITVSVDSPPAQIGAALRQAFGFCTLELGRR
jgi:hypothetical protein